MFTVHSLNWELQEGHKINWRALLTKDNVVENIENFSSAVTKVLEQHVVHHILH